MTNQNIPKVRFKGFDDEWKNKYLSEFFDISSGFTGDSALKNGKYHLTRIETIADGDINIDKLGFSNIEPNEKFRLNKGDILYSNINSLKHMGKVALFKADKTVYHGINLLRLSCKPQYNAEFLFYQLNTEEKRAWARSHANQAVSQASINQTSLGKQKLSHPNLDEQSRIGSLFSTIDSLLSSFKDNLENYQSFKKSMLSKMFPKAGQTVPEIRLDGFEGEWQRDTLNNYLTESRVVGNTGLDSKKITVKLWGKGVFEKNEKYAGSENTQYYKRSSGQFIYSKLDFQNQAFGIIPSELDGYESTLDLPTFDIEGIDKKFLLEYVMRRSFYEYQGLIANGSRKAKRIHPDDFLVMPVIIPTLEEQRVVANYFSNLDELISSYQSKIDSLETLKKKLLQDMFI